MRKNKKLARAFSLLLCGVVSVPIIVTAQSSSPSYRVEESYFGTGGNVETSSPNFRARQGTGALAVGASSSNSFDNIAGPDTPSEPFLEAAVTNNTVNLGTQDPGTTTYASAQGGACNCSFYVRSYLSYEYSVVTASSPPTSENGDQIDAKATQGAPNSGTSIEEFGINLVANTVPGTFGAAPVNEPDNSFADGQAAPGYELSDQFKYVVGDVIAQSPETAGNQGVGKTNYTISYIMKISNVTPAGVYTMNHDLIVVPSF